MAPRLLTRREAFQAPAVHEENIQPAIVVVVIESQAAAGSFQKIFVLTLAAIDGFYGQARLFDHIHEAEAERGALNRPQLRGCGQRDRKSTRLNSSHLGISYAV